ncbi:MAG: hypothetical protein EPO10_11950 [Reyranella sp.]|uniref:hypothetical protein n=1 Tax=Reyranella sp. TaxID=1929291 RepID=UPI0011FCC9F4|nr:hypothetical protein [Reyranella sp.]TAJ91242.1 MAG: hypothetical protein EPO41_15275 [Reyranella sp.]TBR28652.1 MAG: hypothetical protein EPO10_11950 [Reyranella sp.]
MATSKSTTRTASSPPAIRREILAAFAGALCIPTIATVPSRIPAPDPLDVIRRQADLLAAMLTEAHGGAWAATVERGFVLIRPEGGAR